MSLSQEGAVRPRLSLPLPEAAGVGRPLSLRCEQQRQAPPVPLTDSGSSFSSTHILGCFLPGCSRQLSQQ